MAGQHYCLRWNNYQSNMTSVFHQLLQDQAFVDVTLACSEHSLKAHKVVLSACSPYFQKLLLENPCKHPVIIMPHDVSFGDLRFIIEFVYRGEIDVSQAELQGLLRTADQLKIKGLCEVAARESSSSSPTNSEPCSISKRSKLKLPLSNKRRCPDTIRRNIMHEFSDKHSYVDMEHFHLESAESGMLIMKSESSSHATPASHRPSVEDGIVDMEVTNAYSESSLADPSEPRNLVRGEEKIQLPFGRTAEVLANAVSVDKILNIPVVPAAPLQITRRDEVKLELRGAEHPEDIAVEPHHHLDRSCTDEEHTMLITPELLGLIPTSSLHSDMGSDISHKSSKHWSQEDMELALEALRTQTMNLTKASATFGIPSTTLWQRAHRLGINTPKKDSQSKTWSDSDLNLALDELRAGRISANRASKTFHIPSSTLYKIARKEGIKLSAPFNASPTTWNNDDLNRALESIRNGTSVQKAASEFGIPSGTLYGRCKREGIELCKNTPVPWSQTDMYEALESVRQGEMSINQAAIHFNLPYSSLYGRFKRVKYEAVENQSKLEFEMFSCSSEPGPQ